MALSNEQFTEFKCVYFSIFCILIRFWRRILVCLIPKLKMWKWKRCRRWTSLWCSLDRSHKIILNPKRVCLQCISFFQNEFFFSLQHVTGMPIFRIFTDFRKFNLVRMSSVNLDVLRKFPEFGQSRNWGIILQKTHKNTQGNCKGRLPAYHQAWFPSDLRFVNAGTESRLSGSDCGKFGENAKMKWNEDSVGVS